MFSRAASFGRKKKASPADQGKASSSREEHSGLLLEDSEDSTRLRTPVRLPAPDSCRSSAESSPDTSERSAKRGTFMGKAGGAMSSIGSGVRKVGARVGAGVSAIVPDRVERAAATVASKVASVASLGASKVATEVTGVGRRASTAIRNSEQLLMEKALNKLLKIAGERGKLKVKDPYMPNCLQHAIDLAWDEVWDDVELELKESILDPYGTVKASKGTRAAKLDHWAPRPKLCVDGKRPTLRRLAWWFRAKFLYSSYPADASIWKVVRDPVGLSLILCKLGLVPWGSVTIFLVTFFLIDKSDEYQLVQYVLKFKSFQCITAGLVPMARLGMKMHSCLAAIHLGVPEECIEASPASHPRFEVTMALEVLRVLFVYAAFTMLLLGYGHGGVEEIQVLELLRIDAADGTLDGGFRKKKSANTKAKLLAGHSQDERGGAKKRRPTKQPDEEIGEIVGDSSDPEEVHVSQQALREAAEALRLKTGAEVRKGCFLPYFMAYDAAILALCCGWAVFDMRSRGLGPTDEMFWEALYTLKLMYAAFSFPFIFFFVPVLGTALTHAKPTGYDQAGQLCPKLLSNDRRKKHRLDCARAAAERQSNEWQETAKEIGRSAERAAVYIQSRTRTMLQQLRNEDGDEDPVEKAATVMQAHTRGRLARKGPYFGNAAQSQPEPQGSKPSSSEAGEPIQTL